MDTKYEKPNVVAEIGCNHKGNLDIARIINRNNIVKSHESIC